MGELIIEIISTTISESLPKFIGSCIRWCYFLGRKDFRTILNEKWNKRIGILTMITIVTLILWLNN